MIILDLIDIPDIRNGVSPTYLFQSEKILSVTPPPFIIVTYEVKISRKSDCKWFTGYWVWDNSTYRFPLTSEFPTGDHGEFNEIII